jgi:hypothetical protein
MSRFDEVTKKPIPNLFSAEVLRALGTRGGATWERGIAQAEEGASWSQKIREAKAESADIDFNKRFGLENLPFKITKTLLGKITEQIENKDDGDQKIDEKEFLESVVSAGVSHMTKEQYATMFKAIDKDGSGAIDFDEWLQACT